MCKETVKLAFVTNGGAGTLFIQANFIYCVSQYLREEPIKIFVFAHKSKELNDAVFADQDFWEAYYNASERHRALSEYDVSVNLNFYPEIIAMRKEKLAHCPRLLRLLDGWKEFLECDAGRSYYVKHFGLDINGQILAILQGKNCLNILDTTGELGVSRDYDLRLIIHKTESGTLAQWGLQAGEYITLQRGAYPTLNVREVPKIWPVEHYEELVRLLKKCFPEKKIVQLGESENRCCLISGIDLSLVGKTDWEDLKVLLKNAWLHIDGECGMVHLRRMLRGGPSVVLFGPTPIDFYGYDANINISSDACPHWCCKLMESTDERCLLDGSEYNRCMTSIHPYQVLNRIVEWACCEKVRSGGIVTPADSRRELEKDNIRFDDEFADYFFTGRYVYYCEIKRLPLADLWVQFKIDGIPKRMSVMQSPAYQLLEGNNAGYKNLLISEQQICYREHDEQKFWKLFSSIQQEYDGRYKIVVSPEYTIYDGHHRASILCWREGSNYEINAVIAYSIILFPFPKVPHGSKIVLYGLGQIGHIYIKQLISSQYASLVCVIDRSAERMKSFEKDYEVQIVTPDTFFSNNIEYDYIVLSLGNPRNIKDVSDYLIKQGVSLNKIIHNGFIAI